MKSAKPNVAAVFGSLTKQVLTGVCALGFAATVSSSPVSASPLDVGDRWDWQLSGPVDLDRDVEMLALNPDLVTRDQLQVLRSQGIMAACNVSIGTVTDTSADKAAFPVAVVGKNRDGHSGEQYLDIRRLDVLVPLMTKRFLACKAKGFTAVEPDNMDVYEKDSGFALSAKDAIQYATTLAHVAHGLGLRIAQKNAPELTGALLPHFDFAITDRCYQDGWCEQIAAYPRADKPAFNAEYTDADIDFGKACAEGARLNINMIQKDPDLAAPVVTCQAEI
ncbi:endo alpha-1,4 polygalactosaminidase [Roseibium sp.]|uniref:endo alpha-1,4 polygalactosaminidase n=1 Tax=Roseibium sp. TaxID=1936156 RepID=UPI003B5187F4